MIETRRLRLEPIRKHHAKMMLSGLSNTTLYRFTPDDPPESLQSLEDRYQRLEGASSPDGTEKWLNWIVFRKDDSAAMGYVQTTIREHRASDIAYVFFEEYWRQGFAGEAVNAVIGHLFDEFELPTIAAFVDTRNKASNRLVLKLGFHLVETIRSADHFKGSSSDENHYRICRADWLRCGWDDGNYGEQYT